MDPLQTRRLTLLPLDADRARRLTAGKPGPEDRWAEGYPDAGDLAGAERYLRVPADTGDPAPYGAFEIRRRSDGLLMTRPNATNSLVLRGIYTMPEAPRTAASCGKVGM